MTHRSLLLAAVAVFLGLTAPAAAEQIQWSYQGEVVTTGPSAGLGPKVLVSAKKDATGPILTVNTGERVEFVDASGAAAGTTSVAAFRMRFHTDPGDFSNAPFSKDMHTFNLGFKIADTASGASGSVNFKGTINGLLSRESQPPPHGSAGGSLQVGITGLTEQTLKLGEHIYKVSVSPFDFKYGKEIDANRTAFFSPYQDFKVSVQVSDVPEPSTLALAALGAGGIALRAWRRRKSAHLAQPS